jgi:hypothetical protein
VQAPLPMVNVTWTDLNSLAFILPFFNHKHFAVHFIPYIFVFEFLSDLVSLQDCMTAFRVIIFRREFSSLFIGSRCLISVSIG